MANLDKVNDLSDALIIFVNQIISILLQFVDIDNATGAFFNIFIDIFDNTLFRWTVFIAIIGIPVLVYLSRASGEQTGGDLF